MTATPQPKEVHDLSPPPLAPETTVMCCADTWRALGFDPINDPYDRDILITLEMSTRRDPDKKGRMSNKRIARELHVCEKTVARRLAQFNTRLRKALGTIAPPPPSPPSN